MMKSTPDATPTPDQPPVPAGNRWKPSGREAGFLVAGLLVGLVLWLAGPGAPPAGPAAPVAAERPTAWTCSMHPQIQSPKPGSCPICGMDLIPVGDGEDDAGPRELRLSPSAVVLAEVETQPVRRREVAREVRMVGKVDFDETRLNFITAWIPGRLDRMFVDYTGTLVRQGDHLIEIYSPQLLSGQMELLQALEARRKLRDSGSKLLLESAEQTVASTREKLRLWGLGLDQIAEIERSGSTSQHITIRAPIGGIVVHKNKNTGDYVNTGERVYTIADLSQVWVKLDAYESDLPWVRYGQTVRFETEAYPGIRFEGRVVFVDPVLGDDTRTVKVRLNVDNRDGRLKPGMFVRGSLSAPLQAEGQTLDPSLAGKWICPMHWDVIKDAQGVCDQCGMPLAPAESLHRSGQAPTELPLVVPASAVLWTGVRSLVYVRDPDDPSLFRGQEIVLGPRAGDVYVVRAGLEEGQQVVTRGAFKIDSALQIQARPSMMLPPEEARTQVRHEVSPAFLGALGPAFETYLELQAALASDDLAAARAAAQGLRAKVEAVDMRLVDGDGHVAWMGLAKRLRDAAGAANANTIEAARAAFHDVSQAMLELEHGFGHPQGLLREAFCPMARDGQGASWLQRGEEILNPYYGASMLRCGEVRVTFPARDEQSPTPAATPVPTPAATPSPTPAATPSPTPAATPSPTPVEESLAPFHAQLDGVLAAYLRLQQDLAKDQATGAERATELQRALEQVEADGLPATDRAAWSDVGEPALRSAVASLAGAANLEAQRQAFETISTALTAVLARHGHLAARTLRRFHCPMAFRGRGADWLQEDARTLNPYFGARMLRCGSQVEVLPPEGLEPAAAGDGAEAGQ